MPSIALSSRRPIQPVQMPGGSGDAASARAARIAAEASRDEIRALAPLGPASYANVAAAVAAALTSGRALLLRPGDNAVINVPAQVASIGAAVTAIRSWGIPDGATLTINRTDSGETMTSSVTMDHPDGIRIFIYGNRTTPANCVLTASNENDILYVPPGCAIGGFDGFRLVKSGAKARIGILTDGGTILCGPKLEVDNFYYGLAARNGGMIIANGTSTSNRVLVTNAGDVGIWAFLHSYIACAWARSEGADDAANNLGFGIMAEYGSTVACANAYTTTCRRAGFAAYGGQMRAYDATAQSNVGNGFEADRGAIVAHSAFATNNGGWGVFEHDSGSVEANPAITFSGNVLGTQPARWERFESSGQAGLRVLRGTVGRLDVGTGLFVNGTGGAQFQVENATGAVNRIAVQGAATGAQARIFASGSDTNVGIRIDTRGTGSINLNTNGGTSQFQVDHTADAVNRVAVTGAATGGQARIFATGSDTDIPMRYDTKGTGSHFLNTAGGVAQLEVSHTVSAVNRIQISGSATGSQVRISASGSDANVGIRIDTRGTGGINLNTNGGVSQFQVDHTADAVNRVAVTGGATGAAARLFAVGTDTDIGLSIGGKGAGTTRFQTSGGLQLEIGHIASAVNYLVAEGAATAGSVRIRSAGTDANVPMRFDTQGTGSIFLNPGGGNRLEVYSAGVIVRNASATVMQVNATGLGFFGVAPVARPAISGSRAGNAALASLLTSMANLGLITDGST